ncbi:MULTISPECIES: biotin transporter BioY [Clostridium]|uniref:Biotin transporter n=1 Tax=Clostridium ragsdalei P11 TaxID=1353534 RepID=A0A1A6AMW9_9CLOT|nr:MULTISPECIES: biotin transporter BioY [Clostridium]OBR91406.1 biotin transporter BioY [Clostridium ragsdalei P11]QXE17762.1 biotin transporter BioY [Clostridium sp. 001]
MNLKLREMTTTAIFTALTAILAQISIPLPFSPVPITFQILAVYISAVILGSKLGALSQLVYVLLGAVGVPVFANFHGGLSVVLGPTGGYLIAYPIIAYIIGKISEKELSFVKSIIGLIISLIFCYAIGVLQLSFITKISIEKSILVGAIPFIPLDTIKVITAYILGCRVREALIKTNLIKC